jgi:hypothetical protein
MSEINPSPYMNIAIYDLNTRTPYTTPPPVVQAHQTLRIGRDSYLNSDNSRRTDYAKASTSVNHIVRKGRIAWVAGGFLRHGRKIVNGL